MKQSLTITIMADRHAGHHREYAQTYSLEVEAGSLKDVLIQALKDIDEEDFPLGRYSLTLSEPYD